MNPTQIRIILRKTLAGSDGSCVMSGAVLSRAAQALYQAMEKNSVALPYPVVAPALELGSLRAKVFSLENQIKDMKRNTLTFGTP